MKDYTAVIIDDEAPTRALLQEYLQHFPFIKCVASCKDGFEGLKAIGTHRPDLVFLDIQMPRISGLEMLELMEEEHMPHIIFTTAYDQHALKAFDYNTIDYLLKPISLDRFKTAINKVIKHKLLGGKGHVAARISQSEVQEGSLERIVVKTGAGIHIIADQDIYCLEAQDDYVLICTREEEFLKKKTLGFYEKVLDPSAFIRVHRSFIARIDAINRIEPYSRDAYLAVLKNGRKISVSKKGYAQIKHFLEA
jgi:two-component system, LytTR family, response regulator